MRKVAVVTARNTSRRLPGKSTVEIGGKPALAHMIERLKTLPLDDIVIATTGNAEDAPIHAVARAAGVKSFSGSEQDVLGRVVSAARTVNADVVVYCTGDCILLDPELVKQGLRLQEETDADFVSNCIPRSFVGGMDLEILRREVLERLDRELTDPWDREHITEHVYLRPLRYRARYFEAPPHLRHPELQVCMDTEEDLALFRSMFAETPEAASPTFNAEKIVSWLLAHPRDAQSNRATRKRSYRVGMAGLGKIGWRERRPGDAPDYWTHVDAINFIPDLAVAAVAETNEGRLRAFADTNSNVARYPTLGEMVKDQSLDAIYICTPTDQHIADLKTVLAGSSAPLVVCEKPLSNADTGARDVVQAYLGEGRRLIVNYWTRWSDAHAALAASVRTIGDIQTIQRLYSLGLYNSGSYAIDQLRGLFGEITAVQAVSSTPTCRAGDDGVSAIVHFASGMHPAHLIALNGQQHTTTDMDIIGETGRARLIENDAVLEIYQTQPARSSDLVLERKESFGDMTPFLGLAQSVINALRFNREPPITATDALRAVEICDAIRTSSLSGNTLTSVVQGNSV